ncbi:hypothetical protein Vadar_022031 [Vaccinium darrowii]|uniref:Uncharacterized protein n=1 Tax=Vaccinium darrowii TaxID=229202 RepID=A0ACB7Y8R5_9ERIC|nr:hypothetical protein Vadar_022031 [Vaccinium darrowii]
MMEVNGFDGALNREEKRKGERRPTAYGTPVSTSPTPVLSSPPPSNSPTKTPISVKFLSISSSPQTMSLESPPLRSSPLRFMMISETNEELIEHHCALWEETEPLNFFPIFMDNGKLFNDATILSIFYGLDTTREFCDWKHQVKKRPRSIVYDAYSRNKRFSGVGGNFTFLRAYKCHAGDYSNAFFE